MEYIWIICSLIVGLFMWTGIFIVAMSLIIFTKGGTIGNELLQKIFDALFKFENDDYEAL